ncbi:hypothetical protein SAMN05428975_2295 [Mucilaginibacter sp. OK268]|uniref:hypothetical protein n=1 Tax=Mucilaginibacter sp. OK268 TaxID=1881048 RepID=UPI000886A029|nr:hypothetical protein [Mucilaginibacter sp. OK268]SDP71755.1 hypothetical protein SAMN05428975_2295 [Mucilaginibacter sp. OK268]
MKNLTYVVLALLLAVAVIASCKKSENPIASNEKSNARKVTDTIPTPPTPPKDTTKLVPLTGDKITLHAGLYKSSHSDTSYVYFVAQTANLYCANSEINFNNSLDVNNNFSIDLLNAQVPITCKGATGTISSSTIVFWQNNQNPYLVSGSYPIKVTLNGNIYTGSINISPTTITFNWNYTSGVLITPTQIAR